MKPRITMNVRADGEFELWLNKEGRDLLVRELLNLGEGKDHFHMMAREYGPVEIELSLRPYRETDKVLSTGKVMFRTDEWPDELASHLVPFVMQMLLFRSSY